MDSRQYVEKGDQSFYARRYIEALAYYNRAIELDPLNKVAWNNKGLTLVKLRREDEALKAYKKALEIDPNYKTARKNLNKLLERQKKISLVDKDFEIAERFMKEGRYQEAIIHYNLAIRRHPRFPAAFNNRGIAYMKLREYDNAIRSFKKALAIDPHYKVAKENLEKAKNTKKELFKSYITKGNRAMENKKFEEALRSYERAVAINPKSTNAWTNRGVALIALTNYADAIACLTKALQLDPNNQVAARYLKQAKDRLQRKGEFIKLRCPGCHRLFEIRKPKRFPVEIKCPFCGLEGLYTE